MENKILQGNCLDKLKELEDNSVDSIVTDPPYELGFMGKSWDNTGIANNVEMWAECLRVLKPGGHLLAFSGTRTYHRMAVAIEDAGFDIRDQIAWCYGQGFPKSLNISLQIKKKYNIGLCTCNVFEPMLELGYENSNNKRDNISNGEDDRLGSGKQIQHKRNDHNEMAEQVKDTHLSPDNAFRKESGVCELSEKDNKKEQGFEKVGESILQSGVCESISEDEGLRNTTLRSGLEENKTTGEREGQSMSDMQNETTDGIAGSSLNTVQNGGQELNGELGGSLSQLPQQDRENNRKRVEQIKNDCNSEEWNNLSRFICSKCYCLKKDIGGTALKPSIEPICMARKPLAEKTVAENCLKWGTGGINIDESRVDGSDDIPTFTRDLTNAHGNKFGAGVSIPTKSNGFTGVGRFPANLVLEDCEEVRECFPNESERFFKSIITDKLCTLCCLPFDIKHDTMSVCKNTNVNNAEKSLKTTQATTEAIAPQNATTPDNKKFVQSVRSVANLCDLCGTYIAHVLVEGKPAHQEESALGQVFITEQKKQILDNVLASFVELMGKKDTTPTMNDLNLLFGFVFSAIENSTIYSDKGSEVAKNHEWKSLLYQAKASKAERNKGCEGLEDKVFYEMDNDHGNLGHFMVKKAGGEMGDTQMRKNNHPTVKPIALMEYLIKMVTPKGGVVLDPFAGSGSTLVAAKQNGFKYIGIEMTEEYIPIIEARINSCELTLF